jgi:hypothetical protein
MQTRLVNPLTACLKASYPAALQLFTKRKPRSTLIFLQTYPTPQAAQQATGAQIEATLRKGHHTHPKTVAPKIYEGLHQPHLEASEVTIRTKARLMRALVAQRLPRLPLIAAYDKAISELFLTHADSQIFTSLPGAGKRLAPRLLAAWGDERHRYADANSIQALAGTSPVPFESGTYAKVQQRLACLKPLRNAWQQFARLSTQQEGWAKDYYDRKRTQGKSHRMATRALANIWVRIIFARWVKQEPYERTTFVAAQRRHSLSAG